MVLAPVRFISCFMVLVDDAGDNVSRACLKYIYVGSVFW